MQAVDGFGRKTLDVASRIAASAGHGLRLIRRRPPRHPRLVGPRRESPAFVLASGLALAIAAMAFLDRPALEWLDRARGGWRAFLKDVTHFGEGTEILIGSALILVLCLAVRPQGLVRRLRAALFEIGTAAAFTFVSVAGAGLTGSLIKNALGRARPEHLSGASIFELHPLAFTARFASFPSGHSMTAGASAMVLALLFPRLRWLALGAGATVAVSRVFLEAHFPSDVVAGFAYGVAVPLMLAHVLANRGLVFRHRADGRLAPKPIDRPSRWPEVLAAVLAARRQGKTAAEIDAD